MRTVQPAFRRWTLHFPQSSRRRQVGGRDPWPMARAVETAGIQSVWVRRPWLERNAGGVGAPLGGRETGRSRAGPWWI